MALITVLFRTGKDAQFSFHRHPMPMGIFHGLFGKGSIFLKWKGAAIYHNRRKSKFHRIHALCKGHAVVQVQGHRDIKPRIPDTVGPGLHNPGKHLISQLLMQVGGCQQDDRGTFLNHSVHDSIELLNGYEVKCRYCITSFISLLEHQLRVYLSKF